MVFNFQPLDAGTWDAFVELFGEKGACGGCWCMTWRLTAAEFEKQKGAANKKAIQQLTKKNKPIGVLAFLNEKAIGWCAIAPREEYKRLETSRIMKPIDDKPVWSVSCFFIQKEFRNKGLSSQLLKAAIAFAKKNGATIVEGYPQEARKGKMPDVFAWTGLSASFIKAGFKEVERRSETRPIMRYFIK
ncbi:MAG TPA: GNAT family N-acetyltransferase [Chitinophagaceae bacterium]